MSRYGKRWTREELLAVLYLYINQTGAWTSPQNSPAVHALGTAMNRTVASIAMRIANYRSLNPEHSGHGLEGGAKHGSPSFKRLWHEYEREPERVMAEARIAYRKFVP